MHAYSQHNNVMVNGIQISDKECSFTLDPSHHSVYNNLPISGTNSEVAGILSAISNIKTENANRTVMPRVIFSPESGGNQKPNKLRMLNQRQGKIMLNR